MDQSTRILQLIEDLIDSQCTPEQVCTDFPELLPAVRQRWALCQRIDAKIGELFAPSNDSSATDVSMDELPSIPGYQVQSVLGHGGVGVVYRARHLRLERLVALKMLIAGPFASAGERARLIKEAQAVAQLRHANIVQVYDVGEFGGRPYFTMELIEGKTLAQAIAGTPQPAARAVEIMLPLAMAVEFAHRAGIIHRDLKPSNILLAADGAPMISDFGLARNVQNQHSLTLNQMGTPSYMAPEQYLGGANSTKPPADVYSLGAILYEMLAGRPPFRGESAAETQRQLLTQEPVPPSRFNKPVPRDLETICLTCLRKDPGRRYSSAAALAEDVRRFQHGRPILARRAGHLERTTKWIRRHPSLTSVIACALFAGIILIAAAAWLISQNTARSRTVADELNEAALLQHQSRWTEAATAIDRATVRLGNHGPRELQLRLSKLRADSELASRLDVIADNKAYSTLGVQNFRRSDIDYHDAFAKSGVFSDTDPAEVVAARVQASNINDRLISAFYEWSFVTNSKRQEVLWRIICQADHDPNGWRERVRDPAVWDNVDKLAKASDQLPVAQEPVAFCLAVNHRMEASGLDTLGFLQRVEDAHPQDFWANLTLADAMLGRNKLQDATRFYQAAIAIRPGAAIAHHNLGVTFARQGQHTDAMNQYRHALAIDPNSLPSRANLAIEMFHDGRYSEAIEPLRACIRQDPKDMQFPRMLGKALETGGDLAGASQQYGQAVRLEPQNVEMLTSLRDTLLRQNRNEEAIATWKKLLQINGDLHDRWDGYAEFCAFTGRNEEYRAARTQLLTRFANSTDRHICERVGRACLLLPSSPQELRQATALIDRALAQEQSTPTGFINYFKVAKSLADLRAGNFSAAMKGLYGKPMNTLGPAPRLIFAIAEFQSGDTDAAHAALEKAIADFNWNDTSDLHSYWIYKSLRAEAEQLLTPTRVDLAN